MSATPPLLFQGTLLNRQGDTVEGAKIQMWQTDLDGNYLHPLPSAANSPKAPEHTSIVSEFQYFGTDTTDADGDFEFLTYRPGVYPDRPFSHFHVMVWLEDPVVVGDDEEDPLPALVTQFYFRDESPPFFDVLQLDVTEVDSSVYRYGSHVNATIVVNADPSSVGEGVLLAASPKQPEGPFYPAVDFFSMGNDLTSSDDTATQVDVTSEPSTQSPTSGPRLATQPNNSVTLFTSKTPTLQPVQIQAMKTTPTIIAQEAPTQSPTSGPTPAIQPYNSSTQTTSTSSSAAAAGVHMHGCVAICWMAFYVVVRNFV